MTLTGLILAIVGLHHRDTLGYRLVHVLSDLVVGIFGSFVLVVLRRGLFVDDHGVAQLLSRSDLFYTFRALCPVGGGGVDKLGFVLLVASFKRLDLACLLEHLCLFS
jgi:hypothetical protein